MRKAATIIRLLFTMALIYGAYTETGIWTGLCFLFIFIGIEIENYLDGRINP